MGEGVLKQGSTFNVHFFSLRYETNDAVGPSIRPLNAASRALHIVGFVGSVLTLPLDIYVLVKSSIVLHRGSTSDAVTQIRNILDCLPCPREDEVPGLVRGYVWEMFYEVGNDQEENLEVSPSPN